MKNKIFGIFVCILLIATTFPAVGTIVNDNLMISETSDDYNNLIQEFIGVSCKQGDWSEQAKLTASDGAASDGFGRSVSIDGEYALTGAHNDDENGYCSGSAYVFRRSGTTWTQDDKLIASDGETYDNFGWSVSIYGEYALIGAYRKDDYKGSAYVFKRGGTGWVQEDKLTASDGETGDRFAASVSINGDYALLGAWSDDFSKGSAYVFKRSGTSWTQEDKLTASDGESGDVFGRSVSIDGDYALVGASGDDDNGSAYVFRRSGTTWTQEDKLIASDGVPNDDFGFSVSIDGDYALIGAFRDDSVKGSAYVFRRSGTTWTQEDKLTALDGEASDRFGYFVSLDGDYALIGAYEDDSRRGSAYVFRRSGTTWTQEAKLIASDGETNDNFGSVSIDGDYAFVGASGDDSAKGSAYVFTKSTPDLDCLGSLSWSSVTPGDIVTSSFMVANVGDPDSELSWEIETNPTWGTWTFVPSSGTGLTPGMGAITIAVEVVSPDEKNKEYMGDVKIVNSEDSNDFDIIPVNLKTPKNKPFNFNLNLLSWFLERFPNAFPILRKLLEL